MSFSIASSRYVLHRMQKNAWSTWFWMKNCNWNWNFMHNLKILTYWERNKMIYREWTRYPGMRRVFHILFVFYYPCEHVPSILVILYWMVSPFGVVNGQPTCKSLNFDKDILFCLMYYINSIFSKRCEGFTDQSQT